MRSNNPVFARSEEFNRSGATYADPSTWGTGTPGAPGAPGTQVDQGRMTIDSVVQKSAITFALVVAAAAVTWWWIGSVDSTDTIANQENLAELGTAVLAGSGLAFVLSLVNSFKRVISPGLVMVFALAEGVALGGLSKMFEVMYPGVVMQAVLGTFAAFAGTLATYKLLDIKVGQRFRVFVGAAVFGMVGLGLLSIVLGFFGIDTGLFGFGGLGLLMAVAGLVLGVFMLILDFDFVENGVAAGIPERESWRAAFGLTVSLVWIYTNLLRILAIVRGD